MKETVTAYDVANNKEFYPTCEHTRQCMVCECKEKPDADIVNTSKAWLCNECKQAILMVRFRGAEINEVLDRWNREKWNLTENR